MSRVVTNAHFVSDVLGSAALVVLLTWLGAVALKIGAPSRSLAGRA
jgi:membrane-associated phospholipid phosphatase